MEKNSLNNPAIVFEKEAGGVLYQVKDGRFFFLIIHRIKQDDWALPKGHVEGEETLKECALREIREETGWHGKIIAEIGKMEYVHTNQKENKIRNVKVTFFLVKATKEDKALIFDDEVDNSHWLEYNEKLLQKITYPAQKIILKKAFKYLKNNA